MKVILLERGDRLGGIGETVQVKDGFARNFLLPRQKALRATEANKKHFEAQRAERALDPRGRIVDLWRGSPLARADLASWRRFHQSLGATKEIVVHARLKD